MSYPDITGQTVYVGDTSGPAFNGESQRDWMAIDSESAALLSDGSGYAFAQDAWGTTPLPSPGSTFVLVDASNTPIAAFTAAYVYRPFGPTGGIVVSSARYTDWYAQASGTLSDLVGNGQLTSNSDGSGEVCAGVQSGDSLHSNNYTVDLSGATINFGLYGGGFSASSGNCTIARGAYINDTTDLSGYGHTVTLAADLNMYSSAALTVYSAAVDGIVSWSDGALIIAHSIVPASSGGNITVQVSRGNTVVGNQVLSANSTLAIPANAAIAANATIALGSTVWANGTASGGNITLPLTRDGNSAGTLSVADGTPLAIPGNSAIGLGNVITLGGAALATGNLAPGGGNISADWTEAEKAQIRFRLGIDGNAAAPVADGGNLGNVTLGNATCAALADAVLSRSVTNVEGSADCTSLCYVVLAASDSSTQANPGCLTVYRTDGQTVFAQRTITSDAGAAPIVAIGP